MKTLVILKKCNAIISDNRKRILSIRNQRHRDLDGRSLGICSFFFLQKNICSEICNVCFETGRHGFHIWKQGTGVS